MAEIRLRIAELRRKKHLTQQQLADVVGVSFQTISKWEKGAAMPDLTYLPMLAEYFDVSVDQLLGLKPFQEEEYVPAKTESTKFWSEKLEYLIRSRKNSWNDDYAKFLVTLSSGLLTGNPCRNVQFKRPSMETHYWLFSQQAEANLSPSNCLH